MNKVMAQPNGPGPTMAEQAAFVNGRGARLIGAADSFIDSTAADHANRVREVDHELHRWREDNTAASLGKVIGTASRH